MKHIRLPIPVLLSAFILIFHACTLDKDPDIPSGITNEDAPVFISTNLERVAEHSVSARAVLSSFGNLNILRYGWVWSENPAPTLENSRIERESLQRDSFSMEISGLTTGKRYYIRPYVATGSGEIYGPEKDTILIPTFQKTYEGEGIAFRQTRDGGFILLGSIYNETGTESDVNLVKTDAAGELEWEKRFYLGSYSNLYDIQQTTDGGYILLGLHGYTAHLVKTNAAGDIEWKKDLSEYAPGRSIVQTTDGGFFILGGYSPLGVDDVKMYLAKVSSKGDLDWERFLGGGLSIIGNSIKPTIDGGYILAGVVANAFSVGKMYLIKTDASGNVVWEKMVGNYNLNEPVNAVQQTTDGGFILVGTSNYSMYIAKTNSTGDLQWQKRLTSFLAQYGNAVHQTLDGGFVFSGKVANISSDMYLAKTNATGQIEWEKSLGGPHSQDGISVLQTSDGSYIMLGSTVRAQGVEGRMYLVKMDKNGNNF
jgi:hypothetical protein